jgi:aspartyl-tRNA(Asn)/glutamyl-tRNA(Gln) amidotransferase subunit B
VEVEVTPKWREEIRQHLPELQDAKRKRFSEEYGLPEYDARILTSSKPVATYYERAVAAHKNPKSLSNWMMTEVLRELKERGPDTEPEDLPLTADDLASLVKMIDESKITGKIAKDVFAKSMAGDGKPAEIVEREGLAAVSDTGEIERIVDEVIAENADAVAKVKSGQTKAIQALVGQVMKKSRGKANPAVVNEILAKKLG